MSNLFGQLVIGPPGSGKKSTETSQVQSNLLFFLGKTTYCASIQDFENKSRQTRQVYVVNLDAANSNMPYDCSIDLVNLVTADDVSENLRLGPNGSMIFCVEYIEQNLDWLIEQIENLIEKHRTSSKLPPYFLFDCPGQVELYTHHGSMQKILQRLIKHFDFRFCAVNLIDSYYCADSSNFISALLTSLSTMLHLEIAHVNVLSKIDLLESFGPLEFNIDFYTEVLDLSYIMKNKKHKGDQFRARLSKKYRRFNRLLCDVIQDYSLVSFLPLNVQDRASIERLSNTIDKANGFIFGHLKNDELSMRTNLMSNAYGASQFEYEKIAQIREKSMSE